tara:strand:+ start:492 stop:746 length:255 start_codon:yes stop_codon:yes gene_type:complete
MIDIDELKKGLHLSIEPYMELSFDEICELDEDVARQGVWNLREEVKRLRRQIKVAQGVFEHLYDDELEDASWIRWFCNMEDEEE